LERYRAALARPDLTPGAPSLIRSQYREVKAAHDRIAELKQALG
jgi:hypothetical protein